MRIVISKGRIKNTLSNAIRCFAIYYI